jgi:hypothetical protein
MATCSFAASSVAGICTAIVIFPRQVVRCDLMAFALFDAVDQRFGCRDSCSRATTKTTTVASKKEAAFLFLFR